MACPRKSLGDQPSDKKQPAKKYFFSGWFRNLAGLNKGFKKKSDEASGGSKKTGKEQNRDSTRAKEDKQEKDSLRGKGKEAEPGQPGKTGTGSKRLGRVVLHVMPVEKSNRPNFALPRTRTRRNTPAARVPSSTSFSTSSPSNPVSPTRKSSTSSSTSSGSPKLQRTERLYNIYTGAEGQAPDLDPDVGSPSTLSPEGSVSAVELLSSDGHSDSAEVSLKDTLVKGEQQSVPKSTPSPDFPQRWPTPPVVHRSVSVDLIGESKAFLKFRLPNTRIDYPSVLSSALSILNCLSLLFPLHQCDSLCAKLHRRFPLTRIDFLIYAYAATETDIHAFFNSPSSPPELTQLWSDYLWYSPALRRLVSPSEMSLYHKELSKWGSCVDCYERTSISDGSFGCVWQVSIAGETKALKVAQWNSREVPMMWLLKDVGLFVTAEEVLENSDGRLVFTMPLMDTALTDVVMDPDDKWKLKPTRVEWFKNLKFIFFRLFLALRYLHSLGIVHCDVKPDNIFLLGQKSYLGDFGLTRFENSNSNLCGSKRYCAPEILRYEPGAHPPRDMFAAGVTMYEAFAGYACFASGEAILEFKGFSVDCMKALGLAEVPYLRDLLNKLMAADPSRRLSAEQTLRHPFFAHVQ